MKTTFSRRLLVLIPLVFAFPYACSSAHEEEEVPLPAGYEDVIYGGEVTDEALISLVSALDQGAPTNTPSQAATLDMPADAAMLPKTPIPTFAWHFGTVTRNEKHEKQAPGLLPTRLASHGFVGPLLELIGPERSAFAHGTPYSGTATWLVFSTDTDPKLTRVLTSSVSYTPGQAVWDKMVAAGKPITVTLVSAIFADNRVATDGGPFQGSKTTFTITP